MFSMFLSVFLFHNLSQLKERAFQSFVWCEFLIQFFSNLYCINKLISDQIDLKIKFVPLFSNFCCFLYF